METTRPLGIRASSPRLWTGVMSGPFAFAVAFETKYAMVQFICDHHSSWIFWLITAASLLICAFGALEAWRGLQVAGREPGAERAAMRARFMGLSGVGLNIGFALAIVALAVPHLYLGPCE